MKYPNVRHIRAFVEVVRLRSFSAAGRQLHMSQSAISQALARLEEQVGVPLVDRSGAEVVLTQAGEGLLPSALRLLEDADLLMRHGADWAHLRHGSLRLLTIPSIAYRLLPGILRLFQERHPAIAVDVGDDKDQPLRQRLKAGTGDLALLTCDRSEKDFRSMPLLEDRFVVLCPRNHPLARKGQVHEADLVGATLIMLKRGTMLRAYVDGVVMRLPLGQRMIEVEQTHTLIGMVEAGIGIALLSALACPTPALRTVVTRPFYAGERATRVEASRQVGFARPADRLPSLAMSAFVRVTLDYLGSGQFKPPDGTSLLPLSVDEVEAFLR